MAELQTKNTKYGTVNRLSGGCKDNWRNVVTSTYYRKPSGLVRWRKRPIAITLQKPAVRALRAAEAKLGREIKVPGSRQIGRAHV